MLGCQNLIIAVDHKPLLRKFVIEPLKTYQTQHCETLKSVHFGICFVLFTYLEPKTVQQSRLPGILHMNFNRKRMQLDDDTAPIDSRPQSNLFAKLRILNDCTEVATNLEDITRLSVIATMKPIQSITWHRVQTATTCDINLHYLTSIIESCMSGTRKDLPPLLRSYHEFKDDLYTVNGVILYKDRIVISASIQTKS